MAMLRIAYRCIVLGVATVLATGCSSDEPAGPPGTNGNGGTPTAVGIAMGAPSELTIGAAGGRLASSDGKLTLVIPPGALASDTRITIQPISNNAPLGLGTAYRFTPDGGQFA